MVRRHLPTGTPITDPELIRISRGTPVGTVTHSIRDYSDNAEFVSSESVKNVKRRHPVETELTYTGVLDKEYSIYVGEKFGKPFNVKVLKEVTPETHDVFLDWIEFAFKIPGMLGSRAVVVVERKKVMQW